MNALPKTPYFFVLLMTIVFSGCGSDSSTNDENQQNSDEKLEASLNKGTHFQGESCKKCHSPTQEAQIQNDEKFEGGATIFTLLTAKDKEIGSVAKGHTIRLLYEDGTTADFLREDDKEFDGNAYLVTLKDQKFTSTVIDAQGNQVNSSVENSHEKSRMNCNGCHVTEPQNGAPGRIIHHLRDLTQ